MLTNAKYVQSILLWIISTFARRGYGFSSASICRQILLPRSFSCFFSARFYNFMFFDRCKRVPGIVSVDCRRRNLTFLPAHLPSDTTDLMFDFNLLNRLTNAVRRDSLTLKLFEALQLMRGGCLAWAVKAVMFPMTFIILAKKMSYWSLALVHALIFLKDIFENSPLKLISSRPRF